MDVNIPITNDDIHEQQEEFVVLLQVVDGNISVNFTDRTQITVCRISRNDSKCHLQNAMLMA